MSIRESPSLTPPPTHTHTSLGQIKQIVYPFAERNTWYGSQLLLGRRSSKKPFLMSKNENESINILKIAPKFFGQCDLSSAHSLGILMLHPRLATFIFGISRCVSNKWDLMLIFDGSTPAEKSWMDEVSLVPVSRLSLSFPSWGSYACNITFTGHHTHKCSSRIIFYGPIVRRLASHTLR